MDLVTAAACIWGNHRKGEGGAGNTAQEHQEEAATEENSCL